MMASISSKFGGQQASGPSNVDEKSTQCILQDLLTRVPPGGESTSHSIVGPLILTSKQQNSKIAPCLPSVAGPSKFALAAASPVSLDVSRSTPKDHHDKLTLKLDENNAPRPDGTLLEPKLRGLSLSDASEDSFEKLGCNQLVISSDVNLLAKEPPPPRNGPWKTVRNCDCRSYWPRVDEGNIAVWFGPRQRPPSPARSAVCDADDFLSEFLGGGVSQAVSKEAVASQSITLGPKKIRAGNSERSLPGKVADVLPLGKYRPTPCKSPRSRGSSGSSTPTLLRGPLTLLQLSLAGGSITSNTGSPRTKSNASLRSPSSSVSASLDEPAQAKNVEDTLREMFHSLKAVVPDVLAACNNDGIAAFEKLQQMKDDDFNAVVEWASPPPPADAICLSLAEKIGILAEQYKELPKGVLEEFLRRNDQDLDKASAQLLLSKDSDEDQATEEHDRVLAMELSQSSPPKNQRRSQYKQPADSTAGPMTAESLTTGGSSRVNHLQSCFPTTPIAVIQTVLHISKDDLDFAKKILREEGHEEAAQQLQNQTLSPFLANAASEGNRSFSSPARTNFCSPTRDTNADRSSNNQAMYEEQRAETNTLYKKIVQRTQEVEALRQEGRHHDASMLAFQIPELKKQARRANEFAKENIFENMNKSNCVMREIDLHCLHKREAIEKVHHMVEHSVSDPVSDTFCKVVTGWGRGSQDNVPKLRPAVEEYLDKRGIKYGLEKGNNGMMCFRIARGQYLRPYNERI